MNPSEALTSNLQSSDTTLIHSYRMVLKICIIFNYSGQKYTNPEVLCLKIIVCELICPKMTEIKSQNVLNLLIMDVG